jgi:O-antigen/teichoic acid export membrane protein
MLDAWYRTGGRYPLGVTFHQLGRLLEAAALVGAVLLGARPDVAAVGTVVASVVGFSISWLVLRRVVPWVSYQLERPRRDVFAQLVRPGVAYLAFPLGNALSVQGLTIVVGTVLGPGPLVVFSTTRTATRVIIQVLMSINLSVWPELSRSMGAGAVAEARAILRSAVQLALGASVTLASGLAVFGTTAIRWWTRGNVDPPADLLAILLLVVVANSVWFTLTTPLAATNRHIRLAMVYFASTSLAVVLSIPLCAVFGVVGAAGALLAIDIGMLTYVLPAALRIVEDEPGPFLRSMLDVGGAFRSVRSARRLHTAQRATELVGRTRRPD